MNTGVTIDAHLLAENKWRDLMRYGVEAQMGDLAKR
jgi:hypothetical protein